MTLHLTRDEADQLDADGRVVLFREGVTYSDGIGHNPRTDPPAEFVEAAQVCETCDGKGKVVVGAFSYTHGSIVRCPGRDCLDGKRRVAAVVPAIEGPGTYGPTTSGTIAVGYVVVTSGPDQQDDGTWSLGIEVAAS